MVQHEALRTRVAKLLNASDDEIAITASASAGINAIASALDLFFLDTGRYPQGSEGLAALVRRPGNIASWNGPYLKGGVVPPDPWGNPYVYRAPGQ
ncbi:hypothetical protein B4Q13_19425, partial [Lacticaseibacillus rhamnosus]